MLVIGFSLLAGALHADAPQGDVRAEMIDTTLTLSASDAPLSHLLEAIAAAASLQLELEGRLDELTSVEIDRLPLREAIASLLRGRSFLLRPAVWLPEENRGLLMVFAGDRPLKPELARPTEILAAEATALQRWLADLDDEDPKVRIDAISRLAELGSDEATEAIGDAALFDSRISVREEAVYCLAEIGSEGARWFLDRSLLDSEPRIREAALDGLSNLNDEDAAWSLAFVLADEDPELRIEAVYALGEIGGETARTILERALSDEDERVVEAANEALEELSDQG